MFGSRPRPDAAPDHPGQLETGILTQVDWILGALLFLMLIGLLADRLTRR